MADENPEQLSRLKRAATLYAQVSDVLTPARVGVLLGAALLAIVGALGGWSAAGEAVEDTLAQEAGERFEAQPFEITAKRAYVFDELGGLFPAEAGTRYISVSIDVENVSDRPVSAAVLSGGISLDAAGLAELELTDGTTILRSPEVVRTVDSLAQRTFQPGLPVNVAVVWRQAASEPAPEEIGVTFAQHTWRRSVMDDSFGWRDPVPTVRVTLPPDELQAAAEEAGAATDPEEAP